MKFQNNTHECCSSIHLREIPLKEPVIKRQYPAPRSDGNLSINMKVRRPEEVNGQLPEEVNERRNHYKYAYPLQSQLEGTTEHIFYIMMTASNI